MAAANPIKAAHLRALAIQEESAKKAAAAKAAPAAAAAGSAPAAAAVGVKKEPGAAPAQRISIADYKAPRRAIPGVQLKKVVDYLREQRRDVGLEELRAIGVQADDDLRYSLEKNPKVSVTPEGKYRFKPKYDIRNRDELLEALQQFEDGVSMEELADCYATIKEDAKALAEEKRIVIILNTDNKHEIMFPAGDASLRMEVAKDFVDMWRTLTDKFPPENEMEADMAKNGLKPTRQAVQQKIARTKDDEPKKKKVRANRKIHNTHIEGYATQAKNFDPAMAAASAQKGKGGL